MDYEKKYKEALERAKEILECSKKLDSKEVRMVLSFFPELKEESEDERIRKEIISALKFANVKGVYDKHIAWLEKQGEQLFKAIHEAGYMWDSESKKLLSLKAEPIDEQKPVEWSEKDEMYIRELESLVKQVWATAEHKNDKDTIYKMRDLSFFLKTLKPQPQSQWKPSDEHYELEEFAKIVRCNLTGISKAVQKLFEAKYLQLTGNKMYGGFKD